MTRPLRLAVVTDATRYAGAEVSLRHLVTHLADNIHVTVLGVDRDVIERLCAGRPGSETVLLPAPRTPVHADDVLRFRRALSATRPQVVHVNLSSPAACRAPLLAAATIRGLPVVAVQHLPLPTATLSGRLLNRLLSRTVDVHVAVGRRSARQMEAWVGLPAGAAQVVHNGIPMSEHPLVHTGHGEGRPTVCTVTRLDRQKNLDVLLRAIAGIPEVSLIVLGEGPERDRLEQLADALGVRDRVTFTGWVDDPEAVLASSALFVLPSRHEAFPLAILEAMASHVPVVATDVGSVGDAVIHEQTGLLVDAGDVGALCCAIRRLLGEPELADRLADNAQALTRSTFTAERMARSFEAIYAELVASRQGGSSARPRTGSASSAC